MPYAKYLTEEDLRKKNQIDPNANPASAQTPGYVAPSAGGGGGGAPSPTAPRGGTGWTNLQKYLDANQGKGQQSAETLYNAGESKIAGTTAPLKAAVEKGTVKRNEELEKTLKNEAENVDKSKFSEYVGSSYTGPKAADEVQDYKSILNQYNSANRDIEQLSDRDKRAAVFKKNLNDPTYSSGMGALDNFLLNTEGEGWLNGKVAARKTDPKLSRSLDDQFRDWAADGSIRSQQNVMSALKTARDTRQGLYDQNQLEYGAHQTTGRAKKLGDVLNTSDRSRMAALSEMLGEENLFKDADIDPPERFPEPTGPSGAPPPLSDILGDRPSIDDLHLPGAVGGMTGTPGLPRSPDDINPIVSGAPKTPPRLPRPSLPDLEGPKIPFPVTPTGPVDPYEELMRKYGGRYV